MNHISFQPYSKRHACGVVKGRHVSKRRTAVTDRLGKITRYGYDADGQLTEDADNQYQWDAAGNLATITNKSTGHVTSMTYDGLNRRVRIEERDGTNSTVTNYLWCGSQICQKLDDGNSIIAEYFDQGEEHDDTGTTLLYQKDQLGSI